MEEPGDGPHHRLSYPQQTQKAKSGGREYAEIDDEAVVAGANTYFELWNKTHWQEEKAVSQEQSWQIIESLEKRE
jgi:DNA-binding transcriptional regulator/RsmH inhibitor MraZ